MSSPDFSYNLSKNKTAPTVRESEIEADFIQKLEGLKYTIRPDIRDRAALEANFRHHFDALNGVKLTDTEFQRLLDQIVTPDVYEASRALRTKETLLRDDDTQLFYTLVNIKEWCKNAFEVVSQFRSTTDNSHHRYDVLLLINGLPVVHVELKTLEISPRRAMEQIVEYRNDPGNGYTRTLLCFVQLFIVSNRTTTLYFANNNPRHFAFDADERFLPIYQFAARNNEKITHLDAFADHFLTKCTLGQMIDRYMVLVASEQKLMIMRPYQIYAVKAIVDCIEQNCGNGYVWHTTGSGKTLTSFKASTLLKGNDQIHKCLFVVDRKDLDRQTREEFNRFQENCVEENTNTGALVRRLLSDDYADKVIVTTIQKLGLALDESSKHNKRKLARGEASSRQRLERLRDKRMVFIFDECHRSQFGDNHTAIKEFFPNSQLFGFTGTPIFDANASYKKAEGETGTYRTTKDLFERKLHAYTITHAIDDRNVLKFHIDYYKPTGATIRQGQPVDKCAVVQTIMDKHDAATGKRLFNALLATASINDAIEYYAIFKKVQAERQAADPDVTPLKVAAVFSPPAEGNKDVSQLQEDLLQEKEDNQHDPEGKKAALTAIIADYNAQYGTNHDINNFDLYYQDIQQRIKDQQFPNRDMPRKGAEKIDITIVVDMLLTGFDSKYLNTLYVDKNLKHHSLIQAFSRTNRVLNNTKPYGNIIDFRQQQKSVDEAITLFSGEKPDDEARKIWLVDKAPVVIENFQKAVAALNDFMKSQGVAPRPEQVNNLKGDTARAQFINKFREVQRLQTQLDQYTDLEDEERATIEQTLPREDLRAFRGVYLETAQRLEEKRRAPGTRATQVSPEVEQLDFEYVLFASADIDYDYIMKLIAKYSKQSPKKFEMNRGELIRMIQSDAKFMNEREEITEYVRSLKEGVALDEKVIRDGYDAFKAEKRAAEITELAGKHGLTPESLSAFVGTIIKRMIFDGEQLTDLMEPLNLGWRERRERELALMDDLVPLLKKRANGREISGLVAYELEGGR